MASAQMTDGCWDVSPRLSRAIASRASPRAGACMATAQEWVQRPIGPFGGLVYLNPLDVSGRLACGGFLWVCTCSAFPADAGAGLSVVGADSGGAWRNEGRLTGR